MAGGSDEYRLAVGLREVSWGTGSFRYSTVQYSTAQYSTVQYNITSKVQNRYKTFCSVRNLPKGVTCYPNLLSKDHQRMMVDPMFTIV